MATIGWTDAARRAAMPMNTSAVSAAVAQAVPDLGDPQPIAEDRRWQGEVGMRS
jgi:hypothetical protein